MSGNLSPLICEQARRSRDPRFDGRFFIAVRTTGIYCRTVCPARSPNEANVLYFPTAAAAANAGYRPCLRCRPETAPGTPAWSGSPALVQRALRLIADSALDHDNTDALASRLGIGSRQLRRLFVQHLGAPPAVIAQTRRIQFAKQLIDSTSLPFTEIAMASGFGSIRRFNTLMRDTYKRTPTQLRALAPKTSGGCVFQLATRPPFAWRPLLDFLALRAMPGLEQIEGDSYRRSFTLEGKQGSLIARLHDTGAEVTIDYSDSRRYLTIIERVRRLFDLNADPHVIGQHLSADPAFAPLVSRFPGLRVPGCWDPFELAVRAVLGQQVTVRGATTLAGRLVEMFGAPEPVTMAGADLERIGLPKARAEALRTLAIATRDRAIRFDGHSDTEEFIESLCALRGFGPWTAQYIAMRVLGDPDAFPASDLVLVRAARAKNPAALEQRSQPWRPWRAYAAMYLWQGAKNELHLDGLVDRPAAAGRG